MIIANKMNAFFQDIVIKIHNDIFVQINQNIIDVFLCGGVSNKKDISIRDKVRDALDKRTQLRILYPEDLFIEILNKDKNSDLLSLERFLADNCDIICIICESPGSLVELGAFVNNKNTINKVIAVLEDKRQKDKSFIMLGPIKLLKNSSKTREQVIYYSNDNLQDLYRKLKSSIGLKKRQQITTNKKLNTILGLYYFVLLLLYFFVKLEPPQLKEYLRNLFINLNLSNNHFNTLYNSSRNRLFKDRLIHKIRNESISVYALTDRGYVEIDKILYGTGLPNKTKLYDEIRFAIMSIKYYQQHRFP